MSACIRDTNVSVLDSCHQDRLVRLGKYLRTKLTHDCSPTKARDFEGEGGPEDKQRKFEEEHPGDDAVRSNIRQGDDHRRYGVKEAAKSE